MTAGTGSCGRRRGLEQPTARGHRSRQRGGQLLQESGRAGRCRCRNPGRRRPEATTSSAAVVTVLAELNVMMRGRLAFFNTKASMSAFRATSPRCLRPPEVVDAPDCGLRSWRDSGRHDFQRASGDFIRRWRAGARPSGEDQRSYLRPVLAHSVRQPARHRQRNLIAGGADAGARRSIWASRTTWLSMSRMSIGSSLLELVLVDADDDVLAGVDAGLLLGGALLGAILASQFDGRGSCRPWLRISSISAQALSAMSWSELFHHVGTSPRIDHAGDVVSSWIVITDYFTGDAGRELGGSAIASSSALVCRDWVPPNTAAIASVDNCARRCRTDPAR